MMQIKFLTIFIKQSNDVIKIIKNTNIDGY